MKTSNSKNKALSAFLGVAFVLLVALIGCNQADGGGGNNLMSKPKHAITFSVQGTPANCTLKAKVGNSEINSGDKVEEGKVVTFTATHNDGYKVKEWKADGTVVPNNKENTYTHTVGTKDANITVSFEIPKHDINFSVEGENGTLEAEAEGITKTSQSPINVEENKVVTFTATPNDGYRVKEWKVDNNVVANHKDKTYTHTVGTAAVNVTVSFEIPKYTITFSVEGTPANGTLEAEAEGITKTSQSPINVEKGKVVTFTATPNDGYRVKEWKLNNVVQSNKEKTYTHTVGTAAVNVTVSFELDPVEGGAVLILSADNLTISLEVKTEDGTDITVEGCTVSTLKDNRGNLTAKDGRRIVLKGEITEFICEGTPTNKGAITALNVQDLTKLKKLNCYSNQLTALNVQGCTALEELQCASNQLPELNVSGLHALQTLDCSYNKTSTNKKTLTKLIVSDLPALQTLNCIGNNLTELDVQGLTKLERLLCGQNNLTALLNVSDLTALKELNCHDNKLEALNVSGFAKLETLYCEANQLEALSVENCTALKVLDCHQNKLSANVFETLLKDLPTRNENEARAALYTEEKDKKEGNCKVFNAPETLKTAFENAKNEKHWKLEKHTDTDIEEITL